MKDSDLKHLTLINAYIDDIKDTINIFGHDFQLFENNNTFHHAISMCLMQIGENAKYLTDDFQNKTGAEVPWNKIKGMRNWFAHGYNDMDDEVIWDAATDKIDAIKTLCNKIL
jgi:uncharacterized protein with HEPN domain